MMTDEMKARDVESEMYKRPIRMSDGRYLIFYTFGETDAPRVEHAAQEEPQAEAVAEEERRV
ncbi:MAG TPA: hypothetical protein VNA19_01000 [Pyrinomonadaceae bacterium]|jgi:hypothetical protein|nr:hypothetical protein [Pyrinomonadaceae bacterium]